MSKKRVAILISSLQKIQKITFFIFLSLLYSQLLFAATYYVSTTGTDPGMCSGTSNCSIGSPCATIQCAIDVASSGDTVSVAASTTPYTLTTSINFNGKNLTVTGAGVRGSNMTQIVGSGLDPVFLFNNNETSAATVKNFVIQQLGNINGVQISSVTSNPIIQNNVVLMTIGTGGEGITTVTNTSKFQNNITLGGGYGISGISVNNTFINNTAVNAGTYGFYLGTLTNNNAYANAQGITNCSLGVSFTSCTNNNAFNNTTNYPGTSGTNGTTTDPAFIEWASGVSDAITSTTLTKNGAGWTNDQWRGFFLTPNKTKSTPYPYFYLILSNTSDTLTVAIGNMTPAGGVAGDNFAIVDFTPGPSSAPDVVNGGTNTGAPSTDIYGNIRPYPMGGDVDKGAVEYSPQPTMSINDVTVSAGTTAVFTVTLSNSYGQPVTVAYTTANNTAIAGVDYTLTAGTLTFNPGTTTQTISVNTTSKTAYGITKTFFVNLSSPTNATITDSQGIGTITNPNSAPTVTLSASAASFSENGGTVNVIATLSGLSELNTTANLTFGGTAVLNTNYTTSSSAIVVTAGSLTANITLTGVNQGRYHNPDLTVIPSISSVTNGTTGTPSSVNLTLTNVNSPPTVTLSASPTSIASAGGTSTVTATLSTVSGVNTTMNISFSGTAVLNTNYTTSANTITINAGSTTGTLTLTRSTPPTVGSDLSVISTISSVDNSYATIGSPSSATVTLTNTIPTLSIDSVTALESAGTMTFTVTLSSISVSTVTVDYATANGTAIAGTNYTATSGTLTFLPGETTKTIDVTLLNANFGEGNSKTFTVDLSNPSNATLSTATGTGTIQGVNGGGGGEVSIETIGGNSVTVGSGGDTITLTSSTNLSNPSYQWAITSTTTGNIADAGSLSNATSATATYNIPPNPPSQIVTITLTVTGSSASMGVGFHPNKNVFAATSTATATTQIQINGAGPLMGSGRGCSFDPTAPALNQFMKRQLGVVILPILIFFQMRRKKRKI